jgi:hypothetical protein
MCSVLSADCRTKSYFKRYLVNPLKIQQSQIFGNTTNESELRFEVFTALHVDLMDFYTM